MVEPTIITVLVHQDDHHPLADLAEPDRTAVEDPAEVDQAVVDLVAEDAEVVCRKFKRFQSLKFIN